MEWTNQLPVRVVIRLPGSTIGDKKSHFLGFAGGIVSLLGPGLDGLIIVDPLLVWSHDGGVRPVGCSPVDKVWLEHTTWTLTSVNLNFKITLNNIDFAKDDIFVTTIWSYLCAEGTPACITSISGLEVWGSQVCWESPARDGDQLLQTSTLFQGGKLGKLLWIAVRIRAIFLNYIFRCRNKNQFC